jgi:IS5 family transposase
VPEAWMPQADALLDDDLLLAAVYDALGTRHPQSRTRGRRGAPAEMVLRLLVLKHLRHWSYATLEREVRTNLVYRVFTRVGGGKVPDAKTMGRWGLAVAPEVVEQLHQRLVAMARDARVIEGRRMRVDTTVVETPHPLSHRQQPVGRWGARAHADDEAGDRDRRGRRRDAP